MFLGVTPDITEWDSQFKSCCLVLKDNPLADFVVLPSQFKAELWYSNVIAGIIRGALEMINLKVKVYFIKDALRGDEDTVLRVELLEVMSDKYEDDSD